MPAAPGSQASRRYLRRTAIATLAYLASIFVDFHILYHGRLPLLAAVGLALIPSVPIVAIIAIVGLYLKEETDEFQRDLFIQSLLWASGITLALASFWSFVHLFARFPAPDAFHLFLLFWICVGLSSFFVRRRYRGSNE